MKSYLKNLIICCLVFLMAIFSFSSCKNNDENQTETLSFYYCPDSYDTLIEIIEKYNKSCSDDSYKIKIINFESEDEMYTKISTEIMAGGGPDIISTCQRLPFEKLIDGNSLADLNTLISDEINFNDYNETVMDSGIIEDKRFFVPFFYCPDIAITTKEKIDEYQIPDEFNFTYKSLNAELTYYFNQKSEDPFCGTGYGKFFIYQFLDSYVDLYNKTCEFDTDDFKDNLDSVTKIAKNNNENYTEYVFLTPKQTFSGGSITAITNTLISENFQDCNPVIMANARRDSNIISSYVQCGLAVNANADSNKKDKIKSFIEYALSEKVQEYWSGTLYSSGNSDFAGINTIALPVNNNAYKIMLDSAYSFENYIDIEEQESVSVAKNIVDNYISIIEKVNRCDIYNYDNILNTYYNSTVIGSIVDKYINDDLSKDKFIRQLTEATEVYLTE